MYDITCSRIPFIAWTVNPFELSEGYHLFSAVNWKRRQGKTKRKEKKIKDRELKIKDEVMGKCNFK